MLYYDNFEDNDIRAIEKCKKRIKEEEAIIENHKFNINAIDYQKISLIRGLIIPFSESVSKIRYINDFINLKRKDFIEKHDNEIYKTAKKEHDLLKIVLEDNVFGHDIKYNYKITEVIKGGYETYYTSIYFTVNDTLFSFDLPHPNKIDKSNCVYANEGMYCLHYKESCVLHQIESSYYINDIKKAFKEFIEKENNNA